MDGWLVGWLAGSFVGCLAGWLTGLALALVCVACSNVIAIVVVSVRSCCYCCFCHHCRSRCRGACCCRLQNEKKKTNAKTITTTPGKQSILTHLLSFGLVCLSSVVVFVVARLLASHCVFVSISTFCCYFPLNGCWLFGLLNGATCDRQIDRPTKRPIDLSSNRTSDLTTDRPLLPMLCCFCCYWPLVTAAQ